MTAVLQSQYESYRSTQETIELINIKYHDLKHQTMLLRAEVDPERRNAHFNEMEKELREFQPVYETGSPVLNIILTGKSAKIISNQIQFTCMADGKLLEMLHVTDICAIFGNALDNAIEHVSQIEDVQKRIVSLTVTRKKEFLYIETSNYCNKEIRLEHDLPVTTKRDRNIHGYGIRSIVYSVRKYGGNVTFGEENHFFVLRILIPIS